MEEENDDSRQTITARIPRVLAEQVKELADRQRRSVSSLIQILLEEMIEKGNKNV